MLTDIEMAIQEWFTDASINGKVEVAKLYTEMRIEMDKQLEFNLESGQEFSFNTRMVQAATIQERKKERK